MVFLRRRGMAHIVFSPVPCPGHQETNLNSSLQPIFQGSSWQGWGGRVSYARLSPYIAGGPNGGALLCAEFRFARIVFEKLHARSSDGIHIRHNPSSPTAASCTASAPRHTRRPKPAQ